LIKSRRRRWVGLIASTAEIKVPIIIWLENLNARNHSEDLGEDGKITLEWSREIG
jgi:hypothetical protein